MNRNFKVQDITSVLASEIDLRILVYGEVEGMRRNAGEQRGRHSTPQHTHAVVVDR